jgi:hypothetical protein
LSGYVAIAAPGAWFGTPDDVISGAGVDASYRFRLEQHHELGRLEVPVAQILAI